MIRHNRILLAWRKDLRPAVGGHERRHALDSNSSAALKLQVQLLRGGIITQARGSGSSARMQGTP